MLTSFSLTHTHEEREVVIVDRLPTQLGVMSSLVQTKRKKSGDIIRGRIDIGTGKKT